MNPDQWLRLSPLPKNEARMLLQHAGGYSRIELVTRGGDEMPDSVRQHADMLVQRRLNGEPVAYILGVREFYGRRFTVNPSVLIPRPETEHLVEAAIGRLPECGSIWDLGTGSGAVARSRAARPPTGAELDKVVERLKALKLTIRNVPLGSPAAEGACIFTGAPATERVLLAKAY